MPLGIALGGIRKVKNNDSILYSTEIYANKAYNAATHLLRRDGKMYGFGYNQQAQLGDGTQTIRNTVPLKIGNLNWLKISGNQYMTFGIDSFGRIYRWGNTGSSVILTPTLVCADNYSDASMLVGYSSSTPCSLIVLKSNGELWVFGYAANNTTLIGTATSTTITLARFMSPTLWNYIAASQTSNTIIGIKLDGTLWGYGHNQAGQLGFGTTNSALTAFIQIGTSTWTKISTNGWTSMGIKSDGSLWAWGLNTSGQVGDGTTTTRLSPVLIDSGIWTDVSCGTRYSLAVKSGGTLWAWGDNTYGQLGVGDSTARLVPTQVSISNVERCYAGDWSSIALNTGGEAFGFGRICGAANINSTLTPVKI